MVGVLTRRSVGYYERMVEAGGWGGVGVVVSFESIVVDWQERLVGEKRSKAV